MKRKNLLILILGLIAALVIMPAVIAANEGLIGNILGPLAGDNFVNTYFKYASFIDMIIYMVLFWGLAEWTLGAKMQGKGKLVMTGVALIMAVSLGLFEGVMGFNLVSFGPLVLTIVISLMAFAIYKGLTQAGMQKKYALSLCYLGAYSVIMSIILMATSGAALTGPMSKVSFGYLKSDTFQMVTGLAGLLMLPALFLIGSWFVHKLPGMGGGGTPGGGSLGGAAPPPGKPTTPAMQPEEEKKKEEAETETEEAFTLKERNLISSIWKELVKVVNLADAKGEWAPKQKDMVASLELIIKQANKIKSLDKKIRRLARKIKRQAKKIPALVKYESQIMTLADEEKKLDIELIKDLEKAKDYLEEKPPNFREAIRILKYKDGAAKKIHKMWEEISLLLALEEEVDKELKAKS